MLLIVATLYASMCLDIQDCFKTAPAISQGLVREGFSAFAWRLARVQDFRLEVKVADSMRSLGLLKLEEELQDSKKMHLNHTVPRISGEDFCSLQDLLNQSPTP